MNGSTKNPHVFSGHTQYLEKKNILVGIFDQVIRPLFIIKNVHCEIYRVMFENTINWQITEAVENQFP